MKGTSKIAIVIVVLLIGVVFYLAGGMSMLSGLAIGGGGGGLFPSGGGADNCPTDGDTSFTLDVFNPLNTTGSENYDETVVCIGSDGSDFTLTDTTSATASTINCGVDFICKGTSSDGAGGDHAKFTNVRSSVSGAKIENGALKFHTGSSNVNIDVEAPQHGVLEARIYSEDSAAFYYADVDTSAGSWKATGSVFGNSTQNTTVGNTVIGSGGKAMLRMDVRVNANNDEQFEDFGWYLFIDAASNKYDTPAVKIEGTTYTSDCSKLTSDESKAYSGEEYCYKVTGIPITYNDAIEVDIDLNALSGVNPGTSDDVNITFASIGAYTSISDAINVKQGAVKDDASQTQVFTLAEWMLATG